MKRPAYILHKLRNAQLFLFPKGWLGRRKGNSKRLRHGTPGAFGKCRYVIDPTLPDMASRGPRPNTFYKLCNSGRLRDSYL